MALNPKDVPFTREEIYDLVQGWAKVKHFGKVGSLRSYLTEKLKDELPKRTEDKQVLRQTEDQGLIPQDIIETILEDLDSYIPREKQNGP